MQQIPILIQQLDESDLAALLQGLEAINRLINQQADMIRVN
jgi:hypothetical protein